MPNKFQAAKQLMLKGMRALKGAERVEGQPGLWRIEPENLSENKWLTRANKRMLDEGDLAELNGNPNGLRSISGKDRARHAYMTSGALHTLRSNSEGWSFDPSIRGLVQVDKNGNVIGATAVDMRKGAELLSDLDMTRLPPGYLEYIGTVSPDARGLNLMQQTQDWLGDDLLFQAASPKKNVPIYERWGAHLAPEIEGGVPELPYMRLLQRAERKAEDDPRQLRLEGFAGGGSILNKALRYIKRAPHSDIPIENGEVSTLYVNPSESELARLMNTSRRVADIEGGQAAVRFLRDLRNQDIYAADGNKVLHSDITGHLGLDPDKTAKDIWFIDEPQERALNFLRSKPVEKCGGGLASLRSRA